MTMWPSYIIICFGFFTGNLAVFSDDSVSQDERYIKGKEKYEAIQREVSNRPRYSKCWTNALVELQSGCKALTDENQHRMALAFTNCFLIKTGRNSYPCPEEKDISSCTSSMTSEAYNTYTEFFTHTQNICFFLQAQVWQDQTDNTISRLADNSEQVAKQIEDSSILQSDIIKKQNESIKNQEILLKHGNDLRQTLQESSVDVHRMLLEFKDSTTEQRAMIFEVFDRLNSLQSVVMGEFTGFYSLVFYAVSVLVCYLLTSTPRTSGARFWLFVLMSLNVVVERVIVATANYGNVIDEKGNTIDNSALVYGKLWLCRKLFTTSAVLVWMLFAYTFKDYNILNNQLLVEIKKQNSDLKNLLETSTSVALPSLTTRRPSYLSPNVVTAIGQIADHNAGGDCTDFSVERYNTTNTTGYETDSDESDSDSSVDSCLTDQTYQPDDSNSAESFLSFSSSRRTSRESTPALMDEVRFLRNSTPMKEMSSRISPLAKPDGSDHSFLSPSGSSTPVKGKPGRPKGSKNYQNVPRNPYLSNQRHYNLRQRSTPVNNPQVESESADDFSRAVRHLAHVAARNRLKTRYTIERLKRDESKMFFSSDDE